MRRYSFDPSYWFLGTGFALWAILAVVPFSVAARAVLNLVAGVLIISGAAEEFVHAVQLISRRLGWGKFLAGTVGAIVATLPEFVVIAFLVLVDPVTTFAVGLATVYNNTFAFGVYAYFLPKKNGKRGAFPLPPAVTETGIQVLVAGAAVSLVLGLTMITQTLTRHGLETLSAPDLLVTGFAMMVIFAGYMWNMWKYYGTDEHETASSRAGAIGVGSGVHEIAGPRPSALAVAWHSVLGVAGCVIGGKAISVFADTAIHALGVSSFITAFLLVFFAGSAEYGILVQAHRRKEYTIALANAMGGITQGLFLVLPFTVLAIGAAMSVGWVAAGIPIDFQTIILVVMLFPILMMVYEFMLDDRALSNFEVTCMVSVYGLLLYYLLVYG